MLLPRLLAVAFFTLPLLSQVDRLELSLRLRAVERSSAAVADPAHRKAGFAHIERAATGFFAFDLAATARSLSEAELALRGVPAAADVLFANALSLRPKWRPVDATEPPSPRNWDSPSAAAASSPRISVSRPGSTTSRFPTALRSRSCRPRSKSARRSWPEASTCAPLAGVRWQPGAADPAAADLGRRQRRREGRPARGLSQGSRDIDSETLRLLAGMLQSLRSSKREETTLPGAAILADAEALAAAVVSGKTSDDLTRPGQDWIAVPSPTRPQFARIATPTGTKADQSLPVVVPIDRQRVVLVGHSMGAMQAVAAALAAGANYRASAALGGGGRVPANARLSLPSFVGIDSRDFARGNALQLHAALLRTGSKTELRE